MDMDREEKKNDVKDLIVPTILKESDSIDRISQLPDEIRLRIISLLSPSDAVATRVLSKTWLCLLPGWYFDSKSIEYKSLKRILSREEIGKKKSESLKAFSSKDLTFRTYSFCVHDRFDVSCFDTWLNIIAKGIFYGLHLRYEGPGLYSLPRSIFFPTKLNVLSLYGCELNTYGLSEDDFKLDHLRELRLEKVSLSMDRLHNFLKICKNMEKFILKQCKGKIYEVRLCDLKYLQTVEICDSYSSRIGYGIRKISISSPVLHDLIFYGTWAGVCDIKLAFPEQLETLILDTYKFPKFYFDNYFSDFTRLKKLCIYGCEGMKRIDIINASIDSLEYYGDKMVHVVNDTPNLQSFKAIGKDFEQFMFLIETRSCLKKKIIIEFDHRRQIDAKWFLNLKYFVENLSLGTEMTLRIPGLVCFNLEGLLGSVPQRCHPKKLKIRDMCDSSLTSIEDIINGILWSCHPENLVITVTKQPSSLIKGVDNYLKWDENKLEKCCKSSSIKCWRHYLEGVELELFTGTGKKWPHEKKMKINIKFQWTLYTMDNVMTWFRLLVRRINEIL